MTQVDDSPSNAMIFATAFPAVGKERDWEHAIGKLIRTSMSFPGHRGSIVLKPESAETPCYRVITQFDSAHHMRHWHDSPERKQCIDELRPYEQRPAKIEQLSGFESWLTPPATAEGSASKGNANPIPPPKYKTFVVVWIAVYATVLPLIQVLKPLFGSLHPLLASALLAAISVSMMTWIVLPILNKWLRSWLYPTAALDPVPASHDR